MPYKDPAKQREAKRQSERRRRAASGIGLDRLAEEIQGAEGLPEPPTRDFLLKALGRQAREGNVPAIRLLLEEYRRDTPGATGEQSVIDQLADRRSRRQTG